MTIIPIVLAVVTSASGLAEALRSESVNTAFDLVATALTPCRVPHSDFSVEDSSGRVILSPAGNLGSRRVNIGDRIRVGGRVTTTDFNHVFAACTNIETLAVGQPTRTVDASLQQVLSGACDACRVRTRGTLIDYFADEVDLDWLYLILSHDGSAVYAAYRPSDPAELKLLDALVGREITLCGLCTHRPSGCRRSIGRILKLDNLRSLESATQGTPWDPYAVPTIGTLDQTQAAELPRLGRQRTTGQVIAVWKSSSLLLKTEAGTISRVDLAKGNPPPYGQHIEVVGFPETDLYRINFARAIWRKANNNGSDTNIAVAITADLLMSNSKGHAAINPDFHGQAVRLRGIVRSLPSVGNDGRFYLESDGYTLPVDISANPVLAEKLEIGSVIDVTGVCVMDVENWQPNLVFPHIKEVMIVTRTPDDIVVIKRPPWWTPARLSIVIGSLLAVLVGILIWNRALKALAEKRGKALANEELERLESDLKVCERTRLAVELHDSIAQNLTGVSMEIDTALRGDEPLPPVAAQHMGRALRAIDSCRGELRNCLWDLRSQALEEDDMNKAIRLTLSQTIGKANLSVRFNVPRSRFTDNTAHTLLRIIRELAANAVRHGHATEIKVAGSIEDKVLKFSVRDNGCGFDPDACPGVLDGHFGLQGVRERVASFEGNIQIESTPGKGTRVSVAINAPQTDDKEKI